MKYNQQTLHKIEKILDEGEYVVRYERGTFQSGYCILEAKKVVVLNKFLNIEGRINTLVDLIPQININLDRLTLESQKLYDQLKKKAADLAEETAHKEVTLNEVLEKTETVESQTAEATVKISKDVE